MDSPAFAASTAPAEMRSVMSSENPRLEELKRRYAAFGVPSTIRSVWSQDRLDPELNLAFFRGDNAYVWQRRQSLSNDHLRLKFAATAYYAKAIDQLGLADLLTENELFGVHLFEIESGWTVSRELLDSIIEINFLERRLGLSKLPSFNMLDIGGGYGRLVHRVVQSLPNVEAAYCTDAIPESTFVSETYLNFRGVADRAKVVPLDEIEGIVKSRPIHVATNIHSFSECPLEAIQWWLRLVREAEIPYLFIAPNLRTSEPRLVSREADDSHHDFRPFLESLGYGLMAEEPKYGSSILKELGLFPTRYYLFQLLEGVKR